jgi:acyl-CoA thioesterase-1
MFRQIIFLLVAIAAVSCGENQPVDQKTEKVSEKAVPGKKRSKRLVFFGNSLTAGYGLDPSESFPALIQQRIDSLGLDYESVNAGVSGETSAGGLGRIDWILQQPVHVFVLELGANDGLRGIPPEETYRNLDSIIAKVRSKYPDARVVLAGMQVPPTMGQRYARAFGDIYTQLAKENNVALIPFLLQGVGGEVKLNQEDGIHPTAEGQKIVANNIWEILSPLL